MDGRDAQIAVIRVFHDSLPSERFAVGETRKIAAILVADVVGYSRLAGADEDRTLARLRALRSDLIDPTIALHHGRTVKLTGDGALVEFRSVVDAVRCAVEIQRSMIARNSGMPPEQRIEFRIGIHLGDVVEEADGDLMGDAVNIAARLEALAAPCAICLSEDAYRQVSGRLDMEVTDLGPTKLKNIERSIRIYSLQVSVPAQAKPMTALGPPAPKERSSLTPLVVGVAALLIVLAGGASWLLGAYRPTAVPAKAPTAVASNPTTPAEPKHLSIVVLPFTNLSNDPSPGLFRQRTHGELDHRPVAPQRLLRDRAQHRLHVQRQERRRAGNRQRAWGALCARRFCPARRRPHTRQCPAHRRRKRQAYLGRTLRQAAGRSFQNAGRDCLSPRQPIGCGADVCGSASGRTSIESHSMDLFFRGLASLNKGINIENMAQARAYFERALAVDPGNLDALLGVGRVDYSVGGAYLSDDRDARLATGEATVAKVLSQRPDDALAHEIMGGILNQTKRSDQGIAEFERAWPSIRTWPLHRGTSVLLRFLSVTRKKLEPTKTRLCASPRATVSSGYGCILRAAPS